MRIQCRTGGEVIYTGPGDPDNAHDAMDAGGCTHCADGLNADDTHSCGMHPGQDECSPHHTPPGTPCWNPPEVPDRPAGCTVCRPLLIEPMGTILTPAIGG